MIVRWLVILSLFLALPALADGPSRVRYKLPVVPTNANGQKCLDVHQWKSVMAVASEYKKHFDWKLEIEPVLLGYASLDQTYGLLSDNMEESITRLEDTRDGLHIRLTESENLRLKAAKGYRIEKGIMWAVILAETVVIGVLGIRSTTLLPRN